MANKGLSDKVRITSRTQKVFLLLFGIFLAFILLEAGLRIGGLVILSIQEHRNMISIRQKGTFRIMCLGESTTAGQYPRFLEEFLNQRDIGIKFSVIDKGVPSSNTGSIVSQLEANLDKYQPDMVVAMMGINDWGGHLPDEPASSSRKMLFLRSLRVYKLAKLLSLHLITKAKELGLDKQWQENSITQRLTDKIKRMGIAPNFSSRDQPLQQEQMAERPPEMATDNAESYFKEGSRYQGQGKDAEAERAYAKVIALNPKNDQVYLELGHLYRTQGRLLQAEQAFRKAVEFNPDNGWAYKALGNVCRTQGKLSEAEQAYLQVIALNPQNDWIYVDLGWLYQDQGRLEEAQQAFEKAIELNPKNEWAHGGLAWFFRRQGKITEAEQALIKARDANPQNEQAQTELGWFYLEQRKFADAQDIFSKAIMLAPANDRYYRGLAIAHKEGDELKFYQQYQEKVREIEDKNYNAMTVENYRKLKQILDGRQVKLACVQYPIRSIEGLRKIFRGERGIIFVNNGEIFESAVKKEGYKGYFIDIFAGDFGHCTERGNRLLAENIADTIVKEYFHK